MKKTLTEANSILNSFKSPEEVEAYRRGYHDRGGEFQGIITALEIENIKKDERIKDLEALLNEQSMEKVS